MHMAANSCIPVAKPGVHKHWWTPKLDDLKKQCIDASDLWKYYGRPRSGDINKNRIQCKMRYKNAIKEARLNADMQLNDKLYEHLCNKNDIEFWKAWRKRFCTRNLQPTGILNGQTGSDNVRNEFTNYYKDVFQPNNLGADKKYKDLVPGATSNADTVIIAPQMALLDVGILQDCITGLKFNKTPGYDGICNEHNYEVWWRSISGSFVLVV